MLASAAAGHANFTGARFVLIFSAYYQELIAALIGIFTLSDAET